MFEEDGLVRDKESSRNLIDKTAIAGSAVAIWHVPLGSSFDASSSPNCPLKTHFKFIDSNSSTIVFLVIEGRLFQSLKGKDNMQRIFLFLCKTEGEPPGSKSSSVFCRAAASENKQCLQFGTRIPQFTANITMGPTKDRPNSQAAGKRQQEDQEVDLQKVFLSQINPATRQPEISDRKRINSSIH